MLEVLTTARWQLERFSLENELTVDPWGQAVDRIVELKDEEDQNH